MTAPNLVDVKNLTVEFTTRNGIVQAVRDVSFSLAKGETLAIVGESGSGKSVTSYALMRILDANGIIAGGDMTYSGIDLLALKKSEMQDIRGREISMIFQNPRAALNPIRKVGVQIEDVLRQHGQAVRTDAKRKAIEMLELVRIRDAAERYHSYPHELSGGMCQRIVIAIAMACRPRLMIADEPTTGLDVTTQKTVMDLIADLTRQRGMSTVLITHDLGLAAAYCDRVIVMQSGEVVERAGARALFETPEHPYTRKLISATPRLDVTIRDLLPEELRTEMPAGSSPEAATSQPLLSVTNLCKDFPQQSRGGGKLFGKKDEEPSVFRAVDNVSFDIAKGQSVGLVGESGCGKSTTSSMVMRLLDPTSGSLVFDGVNIGAIPSAEFARSPHRSGLQMVFQDPTDSLNPRFTVRRSIIDPILQLGNADDRRHADERVAALADMVGLPGHLLNRFPHQLSGGQKARVGIARAIALNPRLLILDEPTAALDVSVQAVVLNLLVDLRAQLGMSYLFVSHDLNVVRLLCDHVIVMRAGKIVESGATEDVMAEPSNDYTRMLIDAIPQPPIH
jgi:peptide/nickel transport system ATP-binding protein